MKRKLYEDNISGCPKKRIRSQYQESNGKKKFFHDFDITKDKICNLRMKVVMGDSSCKLNNNHKTIVYDEIHDDNIGVKTMRDIFKSLSTCGITFMPFQIKCIMEILKCAIPQIHYKEWNFNKKAILKYYQIADLSHGVVINVPRQMGKTFVVAVVASTLLKFISAAGREKPFTIMLPGLYKSTYEDLIARVSRSLGQNSMPGFEINTNVGSLVLINRNDPTDKRLLFGGTKNSDVSNKMIINKVKRVVYYVLFYSCVFLDNLLLIMICVCIFLFIPHPSSFEYDNINNSDYINKKSGQKIYILKFNCRSYKI